MSTRVQPKATDSISSNMNSNSQQTEKKEESVGCLKKTSNFITGSLESFFYRLGKVVGRNPWVTILIALLVCGVCMVGLLRFEQENRGEKLWVPQDAKAQYDKKWVEDTFPAQSSQVSFILQKPDVLTADVMKLMLKMHQEIVRTTSIYENMNLTWKDICFKKGDQCSISSLLELWSFDADIINKLNKSAILMEVNKRRNVSESPYSKSFFKLEKVVGDIIYDSDGRITGAKLLKAIYFLERRPLSDSNSNGVDPRAKTWEKEFGKIMESNSGVLYNTRTKAGEISEETISGDVLLLTTGYLLVFVYVMVILGKFTRLEIKVWLALAGIVSVGLSVGVSMSLSSAFGLFYGPAHTSLPFLLLGIGVDDLFVIVQSWSNIPLHVHQSMSIEERIGLALKHAGSSITVTTFTDLMAFLVGGTTIIPGLRSFCFYAAIGILCDFILQITFFVAWLTIDARRSDKGRDGCCCCLTLPEDYKPNECGEKSYLQMFYEKIVGKMVVKLPVKMIIFLIAAGLLGANIYGTTELRQQFEPKWFVPTGTVVRDYTDLNDDKFAGDGVPVSVYTKSINYYKEQKQLHELYKKLQSETKYLSKNSVESWYEEYVKWANRTVPQFVNKATFTIEPDVQFYVQLKHFLNSSRGNRFIRDIKWNANNDSVVASRIRAFLKILTETSDQVKAMDTLRDLITGVGFSVEPIVYNTLILFAESHKVIAEELFRNIILGMVVVFLVTFVIIASPVTSILVFVCVVLTVVDVTGLMYFWDLTIDTVSTVIIIIAIGLSVDYASHVGHTFLVKSGTRAERTIKMYRDIGPAVWNGGFSTLLAVVLLSTSKSHVFTTFFKVLFGVVVFGIFHGLFFLPAILSIIGPAPYDSAKKMESTSMEADFGREKAREAQVVASHTNKGIENGEAVYARNGPFVVNNAAEKKETTTNGIESKTGNASVLEVRL